MAGGENRDDAHRSGKWFVSRTLELAQCDTSSSYRVSSRPSTGQSRPHLTPVLQGLAEYGALPPSSASAGRRHGLDDGATAPRPPRSLPKASRHTVLSLRTGGRRPPLPS